jgi:hypothetical protein
VGPELKFTLFLGLFKQLIRRLVRFQADKNANLLDVLQCRVELIEPAKKPLLKLMF